LRTVVFIFISSLFFICENSGIGYLINSCYSGYAYSYLKQTGMSIIKDVPRIKATLYIIYHIHLHHCVRPPPAEDINCRARFTNAPTGSFGERSLHYDGRKSEIATPSEARFAMTKKRGGDFGMGISQIKKGRRRPLLFASSPFDKIPDYFLQILFVLLIDQSVLLKDWHKA